METRKNITAGVLFWTPAPARTSPTSSVISEDGWEDEDGEQAGKEDDFINQMDDNGIIGLAEALDTVEFGGICSDADAEYNPSRCSSPPEEADPSGCERDTPPEEWNYKLGEPLSFTEAAGEDVQILSPSGDDTRSSFTSQAAGEVVRQRNDERLSERIKHLDVMEVEKDGEKEMKRSDSSSKTCEQSSALAELSVNKEESEKIRARPCVSELLVFEPAEVSDPRRPVSQAASAVTAPTFPHLLHFTAEEMAAAPGIEAETFPEMGFIESRPESRSSHISLTPSPRRPMSGQELKELQTSDVPPEQLMANCYSGFSNGPLKGSVKSDKRLRKMRQGSPEAAHSRNHSLTTVGADRTPRARTRAAEVTESRNGPLCYRTPDFSQVEPRVRFPKGGYKPPKSRRSPKRESLSPQLPMVFKSPADIVKEVLLNTTDGSPVPSDLNRTLISAANSTMPQEFRCRQQATTLLEQLQEDYNRLLTKYAEAENTIDRLRLEAKVSCVEKEQPWPRQHEHITETAVNLYSDPPKPGHLVQSGLNRDASRVMTLDFPQAQRPEINSASPHPNGHGNNQSQSLQVGQQLAKILYNQADKFLQQLQTFEDLLQRGKLQPSEQMNGLSQLAEGLSSLERGYLLARDEHRLMQQRGAGLSHFDPERELERLIYQCGLHMDELKEQVEQMRQEQPTCEAPPSPPPQPTPSSVPSDRGATQPQIPLALLLDQEGAAEVEANSARKQSDEGESAMDDEDIQNFLYFTPQNGKYRRVEQDFDTLMDHYQSFKELPKMFDQNHTDIQPREDDRMRRGAETGPVQVQKNLPQRVKAKSGHQESPAGVSKQRTSRSSPPSRRDSSQSMLLTVHPPSGHQRLEMGKSHSSSLSSLGEIAAAGRRNSKLQSGSSRVLSQDGIISPETDSGFVGSESSRLTPAAAPSPLHQRASQSTAVHQEGSTGKHQTGPVSAPSPAFSTSHSRTAAETRGAPHLGPQQRYRSRERRRTFSCSPPRWDSQTEQTRANSVASENDSTHTVSEDGQSDQYTESITSLHSSQPSSSPTAWYRHSDPLRALGSRQVANRKEAMQTLQTEVTTLKERLESCLNNKPLRPMRAAPPAQVKDTHHYTSTPRIRERHQSDVSRGRKERRVVVEVEEESTIRRAARERSPCVDRQKTQRDISSELKPPTLQPQPQPRVSRCTQTSTAAPNSCRSHTNTVHSENERLRQRPSVSTQVPDRADEPDGKSHQPPLCPECHRGRTERPGGGNREPVHSSHCRLCPVCGGPKTHGGTKPDCRRDSDAATHTSCQHTQSPDRVARSRYAAAPPALLQCMPVCTPPLLLYSVPLHMSPGNNTGTSSGVRGEEEVRGRLRVRRTLSTAKQPCLDSSLNRAIRAARHMKHTSGHMARSLATGLQYHELLTQSYS